MDYMFWVWLAVIVVTAVIEFVTTELASIWFTFGAVPPFILAGTRAVSWVWQLVIFIVLSSILILALRPITKKWLFKGKQEKTNTDALIGKKFRLLTLIDFETVGSLKANGVVWSAVSANGEKVDSGEIVEVLKIAGNKLVVRKINKDKEDK